jgi:hypothetical protein
MGLANVGRAADIRRSDILFFMACEAEKQGMFVHSQQLLDRARNLSRQSGWSLSTEYATRLLQFADSCVDCGRLETAEPLYREALSILVKARGAGHLSTALALRNLAELCRQQGNSGEAALLNLQVDSILAHYRPTGPV